jgi:large subunit ribosomal protein L24e
MVERRVCSFCGNEIEPGTGKMYVKIDGTIYNFCKNKCHKNLIELHRVPRRTKWTQPYLREKSSKMTTKGKKAPRKKPGAPPKKKTPTRKVAAPEKKAGVKKAPIKETADKKE